MRKPEKNNFTIRKVPLQVLLTLFTDLYNGGADFVDIHADIDENRKQDNITVSVPIEYMSDEAKDAHQENIDMPPGIEEMEDDDDDDNDVVEEVVNLTEEDLQMLLSYV